MASKIKKFFKSKKNEAKFKLGMAGPGHRLGDAPSSSSSQSKSAPKPAAPRAPLSAEAQQAAAAALARLEQRPSDKPAFNTSLAAVRAQAKRELEAEMAAAAQDKDKPESSAPSQSSLNVVQDPAQLAVSGIFFTCPLIGPEVLPKEEWHAKIREFLYEQLEHERGLTAVIMIHTLNKNKEKVEQCVKTIHRMFENIVNSPGEEKYRRVKVESRAFQDKIKDMEGGLELLLAAGFQEHEEVNTSGVAEKFLIFPEEHLADVEQLSLLCDALDSAEPITLELDRGLQVLLPSQASRRQQLPQDFFRLSPEEIKREQQLRSEAVERGMMLRTKAMREKEEMREMKMYKYAIIRIRFPDAVLLQGTFNVYEKLEAVLNFVRESVVSIENAEEVRHFSLVTPIGQKLTEGSPEVENSLLELRLVPATILNFSWDTPCPAGVEEAYLKPELMILMQPLQ
ncbi:hypothetical protein B566_EDAN011975 [Ephemera danica]|nr:hypothetical protein B566_EDAN011975 [Ephemera danica]